MARVYTGTFRATTRVRYVPPSNTTILPGQAATNYSPYILTNAGSGTGDDADLIVIDAIRIDNQDFRDTMGAGTLAEIQMWRVAASEGPPEQEGMSLPIVAMDSTNSTAGITAWQGRYDHTGVEEEIRANYALTRIPLPFTGPWGSMSGAVASGGVERHVLADGETFQIRIVPPAVGSADTMAAMEVRLRLQKPNGDTYFVRAMSGQATNVLNLRNTTGDVLEIGEARMTDAIVSAATARRYELTIATSIIAWDEMGTIVEHDTSKPPPPWAQVGSGHSFWNGPETWIDPDDRLGILLTGVGNGNGVGGAFMPQWYPLTRAAPSKVLRPGKSLILTTPNQQAFYRGEHDITVTFSTYAVPAPTGGGGLSEIAYGFVG